MLVTRGLLMPELQELYDTLRKGRDAAVHGELDPTITQYKEYTNQAAFLVGFLKGVSAKLEENKPRG